MSADYLSPTTIAERMELPRSTVYDMIRRGEFGDVVNYGTEDRPRYRVPVEAYDAWRESRKVRPLLDPMPVPGSRSGGSVRREDVIPLRRAS